MPPVTATAAPVFSTDLSACKIARGRVLPQTYLDLARRDRNFRCAAKVPPDALEAYGQGGERVDGSGIRDGFFFIRVDLDGDGLCDWFLTSNAPQSTGGDRSSFNTFYLWRAGRWLRSGADIRKGKPDAVGFGRTDNQQRDWLFGETLALLRDTTAGKAALYDPGYRFSL